MRWRAAALLTLVAWCAVAVAVRRSTAITDDWHGWRQADTQAIARNFAFEEFAPLRPRIDWRGDGPGYVETELQLYPALIALALRAGGDDTPWPGQLLSLACTALAAALLFAALARRFGGPAAYLALLAVLGHQGMLVISTSIQPDSLSLLAFTIGFVAFADYLEHRTSPRFALWVAATAIAGLVKPTTLELGVAQVALALLAARRDGLRVLRDPRLWLGWAIIVAAVAVFLLHARGLFVAYGNTFGVLSGGDSKLLALAVLASPEPWLGLARYTVVWGTGVLAVPAAIYLLWRRRLPPETLALAAGALAVLLLALRYTSGRFGTHYHLPHAVLGGWLVAAAAADLLPRLRPAARAILVVAVAAAALVSGARAIRFLRALPAEPETALGERLAALAAPGTLVAVRARAESYNAEWRTLNNYEDPRIFYLSRTRGWVLPNDLAGAARLAEVTARGARFYVHVRQKPIDAELAAWLAAHAQLVEQSPAGEIYALSRTK